MNLFEEYSENKEGRDFVCGDIHGCLHMFISELESVEFVEDVDRVFCTGDLIDRGPDSDAMLAVLEQPWFHSVMGNHEHMVLVREGLVDNPWGSDAGDIHDRNGGTWWKYSRNTETYLKYFKDLPLMIQVGNVGIVHARYPGEVWKTDLEISAELLDTFLWDRTLLSFSYADGLVSGIDTIYCGHSIIDKPRKVGTHYMIDTGAFLHDIAGRGKLTLLEM